MMISVKEDAGACSEDNPGPCETAEADEEGAEAASAAALGGATEHDAEADKPYQTQAEAKDPGGGDKADVEEEEEKKVEEAGRPHSMRGGRTMTDLDKDAKTRETDFLKKKEEEEGVEKEKEEMDESYFPEDHDIRSKARFQMNEALMKRWGYTKK
jgi:hypothetical protein